MNYVTAALLVTSCWGMVSPSFHGDKDRHLKPEVNDFHHHGNLSHENKHNEREANSYYTLHDPYQHRRDFHPRDRAKYTDNSRYPMVYRTEGKGAVEISRGNAAEVPNSMTRNSVVGHHATDAIPTISKDVENGRSHFGKKGRMFKNGKAKSQRRACKRLCPPNRTVVAMKGNNSVILPNPCVANRWIHLSGPSPGTKIHEGLHTITGTLAPTNKFCQYQYKVLVRSCESLRPYENDTVIDCMKDYLWGSTCRITCGKNKKPNGPTELECTDNLTWSQPMPKCMDSRPKVRAKSGCKMPKIKSNSRIWCQTADLIPVRDRILKEGSSCRFYKNGKIIAITCKKGIWKGIRKINQTQ